VGGRVVMGSFGFDWIYSSRITGRHACRRMKLCVCINHINYDRDIFKELNKITIFKVIIGEENMLYWMALKQ